VAAVKLSVLLPEFVTPILCVGGFPPPWVAENVSADEDNVSTGCGGGGADTTKVTVTVAGEP
jgi:hypothetical protein